MGGGIPEPLDETLRGRNYSQVGNFPVSSHNDPCHTGDRGLPALMEGTTLGESRGGLDADDGPFVELLDGPGAGVGE